MWACFHVLSSRHRCLVQTEKKKLCCIFLTTCSTSEECKASTCSSTIAAYNKALLHSLTKLITIFNKVDTHIRVLGSASKLTKKIVH